MSRPQIAIFTGARGRGSNMSALVQAAQDPRFPAQVAVVVAPRPGTPAEERATALGVETRILNPDSKDYAVQIESLIQELGIDLVCLAGYTRLFPKEIVAQHPTQIVNIHPALLPKFGGKGMYGHHVHEAVIASGDALTGCTVHYVSERYDEGNTILQRTCPVLPGDTPETLAARVLEQEHIAYPEAVFQLFTAK
ncbi:MAG: phosphoribosylglycinamide formyltransferase [Armatimonadetes bacterium]|nr:phosphoribosylglycinamide formyltransferase [Armatimonadota bacterium]MBS1712665.1 phosphoribosylglycinamide formyltransferase [Armatimonadota bacterium]MBX3108079.1 phosphoribosylglycinamide formyltransferase [Fimbriimonadaceae bacterium]